MFRSTALRLVLPAIVGLLGACSPGPPSRPTSTVLPAAERQELKVAVGEDPFLRGNPPASNLGLLAAGPNPGIFETLTQLTPAFGLRPGLAVRWQARSSTTWRFELRHGVKFHDERPFDAGAALGALEGIALRANRPRGLDPGTVRILQDDEIEIELATPNLRLAEQLANPSLAIQAPGTSAGDGHDAPNTPTGTGPFEFSSYRRDTDLVVQANPEHWGGAPRLSSITFRFSSERESSRLFAIGQADALGMIPYQSMARLSERFGRMASSAPARTAYLLLNNGGPEPWATLKQDDLRHAIALAIDRKTVTSTAWPEFAEPSETVIAPRVLGAGSDLVRPETPDREAARRLLERSGWVAGADGIRTRDGKRLTLSLLLARPPEQQAAGAEISKELREAGIEVVPLDPAPAAPPARVNQGTFDLFFDLRYQEDANACAHCRFFSVLPGGQLAFAGAVGGGREADDLFERSFRTASPDSVREMSGRLLHLVQSERALAVPIAALKTVWQLNPRVQGFEPAPLPGAQRWDQVWLSI
ncbi:MAG: ABC transporter substrate-binding protein [Actinomycetota bacterium]